MASPVDSNRVGTNVTTASTTWNVNVGSPAAGTLLIVFMRCASSPLTVSFTGYTPMFTDSSDASDDTTRGFYRVADGSEGSTDTATMGQAVKGATICWLVTGADVATVTPDEYGSIAVGTTANATTNNCDPAAGSHDYLFITCLGMDSETATATIPSGYANQASANSGTAGAVAANVIIWGGSLQKTGSSEDPGDWTSTAPNSGWTTFTVAMAAADPATYQPRNPGVNFQDPAVFMGGIKRAWHRRRSGIFVPEYVI